MVTKVVTKININKHRDKIMFRFTYVGRHTVYTDIPYNDKGLVKANRLAKVIQDDIIGNTFDFSLDKYRDKKDTREIVDIYKEWGNGHFNDPNYFRLINIFKETKLVDLNTTVKNKPWSVQVFNRRLRIMNSFLDYLVKKGKIKANPIDLENRRQKSRKSKPERKPLSTQEIQLILEAFKSNSCCPANSPVLHSHYYPFLYFMFKYGTRNEEAIGLKIKDVNLDGNYILVHESLALDVSINKKVQKGTKTGKSRKLPMDKDTIDVLVLIMDRNKDEYLFVSPRGKTINDQLFQKRVFHKVLEKLGIDRRDLYCCRHSFISRALEQGMSVAQVAYLAGNSPDTVYKYYAHIIDMPKSLPGLI